MAENKCVLTLLYGHATADVGQHSPFVPCRPLPPLGSRHQNTFLPSFLLFSHKDISGKIDLLRPTNLRNLVFLEGGWWCHHCVESSHAPKALRRWEAAAVCNFETRIALPDSKKGHIFCTHLWPLAFKTFRWSLFRIQVINRGIAINDRINRDAQRDESHCIHSKLKSRREK